MAFITIDSVSASHTVSVKGYSVKLTNSEYNKLKNNDYFWAVKDTGKKGKIKTTVPKYKIVYKKKAVYKYKYKTTTVKASREYFTSTPKGYHVIKVKSFKKKGIKYYKKTWKSNKKVKTIKKVKTYKKIGTKVTYKKVPIKITIEKYDGEIWAYLFKDLPARGAYIEMAEKRIYL